MLHVGEDVQQMRGETGYLRVRRVKQRPPDPHVCTLLSNTVSWGYSYSYRGRNNQLHLKCDFWHKFFKKHEILVTL